MDDLRILPVTNEELILNVATMAEEIWHEYFPALISEEQIDYMLEKFLSFDSIFEQIQNGYEYFLLIHDYTFAGFAGVHEENGSLFLSKLYIHKDFRGNGISSKVMKNLIELCKVRSLDKIWPVTVAMSLLSPSINTLDSFRHENKSAISAAGL